MQVAVRYITAVAVAIGFIAFGRFGVWPVQILGVLMLVAIPVVGFIQYTHVPGDDDFSLVAGDRVPDAVDALALPAVDPYLAAGVGLSAVDDIGTGLP